MQVPGLFDPLRAHLLSHLELTDLSSLAATVLRFRELHDAAPEVWHAAFARELPGFRASASWSGAERREVQKLLPALRRAAVLAPEVMLRDLAHVRRLWDVLRAMRCDGDPVAVGNLQCIQPVDDEPIGPFRVSVHGEELDLCFVWSPWGELWCGATPVAEPTPGSRRSITVDLSLAVPDASHVVSRHWGQRLQIGCWRPIGGEGSVELRDALAAGPSAVESSWLGLRARAEIFQRPGLQSQL